MPAPSKSVTLVTGANTGIGYEIVKALYESPTSYEIILGGRTLSKVETAKNKLTSEFPSSPSTLSTLQVDISSDASIEAASTAIKTRHGRLDILINNAGACSCQPFRANLLTPSLGVGFDTQIATGAMTIRQAWNACWNTNTTGTYVLTHALAPLLIKSRDPRLVFLTSGTSTLTGTEDLSSRLSIPPPGGWPKTNTFLPLSAYHSSKTGMNMMAREWERELRNDGVKVFLVNPGLLATAWVHLCMTRCASMAPTSPRLVES